MPQNTLFYPLGDTAPAGKITAGSILLLIPLINICLLIGFGLLLIYPVIKLFQGISNCCKLASASNTETLAIGAKK